MEQSCMLFRKVLYEHNSISMQDWMIGCGWTLLIVAATKANPCRHPSASALPTLPSMDTKVLGVTLEMKVLETVNWFCISPRHKLISLHMRIISSLTKPMKEWLKRWRQEKSRLPWRSVDVYNGLAAILQPFESEALKRAITMGGKLFLIFLESPDLVILTQKGY